MISDVYPDLVWDYIFECSLAQNLPRFSLLFGGYWMEVLPEDYVIAITTDDKFCTVCLRAKDDFDSWILGDVFLRNWYSIHELDNKQLGFVPFKGSNKSAPIQSTSPTPPSEVLP